MYDVKVSICKKYQISYSHHVDLKKMDSISDYRFKTTKRRILRHKINNGQCNFVKPTLPNYPYYSELFQTIG